MSKSARVLAVGALLTAMSLGSAAHAQTSGTPSQPASGTPSQPAEGSQPGSASATDPGSTTTTTAPPPAVRRLPVTGSSRHGQVGTTVTLTADLSGCSQFTSASGLFLDHAGRGRPLAGQTVTRDLRLIARYTVSARDAVGWGRFKVACYQDMTTIGLGNFSFEVRPAPSLPPRPIPVTVSVSPRSGRPGTTVTITADVRGGCDPAYAFFQDRKGWGVSAAAKGTTIVRVSDRQLVARYTITNNDAVGRGRFGVACDLRQNTYRIGYASFKVRSHQAPIPPNGPDKPPTGGDPVNYGGDGTVQLPDQIDTGLGGTADRGHDPVWLLLPAGLLLIAAALGLRLRQVSRRRP